MHSPKYPMKSRNPSSSSSPGSSCANSRGTSRTGSGKRKSKARSAIPRLDLTEKLTGRRGPQSGEESVSFSDEEAEPRSSAADGMLKDETEGCLVSPRNPTLRVQHVVKEDGRLDLRPYLEVRGVLGKGATGSVCLAKWIESGEYVAVKKIKKIGLNESQLARCRSEYQRLDRCQHPSIVALRAVLEDSHAFYIVTELSDLGDLWSYVSGRLYPLDMDTVARVFLDLLAGLKYLHENHLSHRDVKPHNVMLKTRDDGTLRAFFIDFGLSTHTRDIETVGAACGTLYYAAPELLSRLPYTGREIDVWSLGVVLYYISTGALPFLGEDRAAIIRRILRDPVTFPLCNSLPDSLKHLMQRMLCKDRVERASVDEIFQMPFCTAFLMRQLMVLETSSSPLATHAAPPAAAEGGSVGLASVASHLPSAAGAGTMASAAAHTPESGSFGFTDDLGLVYRYDLRIQLGTSMLRVVTREMVMTAAAVKKFLRSHVGGKLRLLAPRGDGRSRSLKGVLRPGVLHCTAVVTESSPLGRQLVRVLDVLDVLPVPVLVCSRVCDVTYANAAAHKLLLRQSSGSLVGFSFASMLAESAPKLFGVGGTLLAKSLVNVPAVLKGSRGPVMVAVTTAAVRTKGLRGLVVLLRPLEKDMLGKHPSKTTAASVAMLPGSSSITDLASHRRTSSPVAMLHGVASLPLQRTISTKSTTSDSDRVRGDYSESYDDELDDVHPEDSLRPTSPLMMMGGGGGSELSTAAASVLLGGLAVFTSAAVVLQCPAPFAHAVGAASPAELQGQSAERFVAPVCMGALRAALQYAAEASSEEGLVFHALIQRRHDSLFRSMRLVKLPSVFGQGLFGAVLELSAAPVEPLRQFQRLIFQPGFLSTHQAFVVMNPEFKILAACQTEILGFDDDELVGDSLRRMLPTVHMETFSALFKKFGDASSRKRLPSIEPRNVSFLDAVRARRHGVISFYSHRFEDDKLFITTLLQLA